MAELSGKAAEDLLDEILRKNERQRAESLALAKEDAARRGKEPFDLAKLETMCDTSRDGVMDPVGVRQRRFETLYYVEHPEYTTLAELAELIGVLNKY